MAETTDVAIIGGGAAGCAAAYYLAEVGVKSTIIEREGVGSQASGYSAGGLNPLQGAGIPGPLGAFAWESFRMHLDLAGPLTDRTGIDYQLRTVSQIKLAFDEAEFPELRETIDIFSSAAGFEARWLDAEDVQRLEPRVTPNAIGGAYEFGNAALDSLRFTRALAAAAQDSGCILRKDTVRGIEASAGNAVRLLLDDDELDCGQVVLATGPWSRLAEPWLRTYIPVDPLKGEILRLAISGLPLRHDISGGGSSLYPKPDGLVWCGTTEDWRGFDREPLQETKERIMELAIRLVPDLSAARVVEHTACLRPVTPDWLPLLGPVPGFENIFLATGAGKKGILLAPAIGKCVADLVTTGETDLPIDGFSPERFAAHE